MNGDGRRLSSRNPEICLIHQPGRPAGGAAAGQCRRGEMRAAQRWKEVWPVLSITFVVCVAPSSGGGGGAKQNPLIE